MKEQAYNILVNSKKKISKFMVSSSRLAQCERPEKKLLKDIDEDVKFFRSLKDENLVRPRSLVFSHSSAGKQTCGIIEKLWNRDLWAAKENWSTYSLNVPQVVTPYMDYRQLCSAFLECSRAKLMGLEKTRRLISEQEHLETIALSS